MYKNLLGLHGGIDETYWKVIDVSEPYSSKFWPAIGEDGKEKRFSSFPDWDSYLAARQERRRVTVRLTIAGNPIAAEETIKSLTGKRCLSTTPNSLDIFVIEDGPDE